MLTSIFPMGGGQDVSFVAILAVTTNAGAAVTCTLDGTTYQSEDAQATRHVFKLFAPGEWTVTATYEEYGKTVSKVVDVQSDGEALEVDAAYVHVYGVARDTSLTSPDWERTDEAVGMSAAPSVGTAAGSSDFDGCMPWKGMARETLSTGDVMVKIPKFYYRRYREGSVEHIRIADNPIDGFSVHPLFRHAGVETDCAYVGAYKSSGNNRSVAGQSPTTNITRAAFRSHARGKGDGWGILDIAALSAIQMLILVEFATNNVQAAIGRGFCDGNSASLSSGSCDGVPGLTGRTAGTDGKTGVVYRGIENLWGSLWEYVDGINLINGKYYVCNAPAQYADDTATNYEELSFAGALNWSRAFITQEGVDAGDNPHVLMPSAAGGGSESTYHCDACWSVAGSVWRVAVVGGAYSDGSACGLFTAYLGNDSSNFSASNGSRLLYIPA